MSIHSERHNLLKNQSGNAKIAFHKRSGESEDGVEYFDTLASVAPSPYDVVAAGDELSARKQFLAKYFVLLKQWLNKFEWEFVKQLYVEGIDEKSLFDKLGLSPKRFKSAIANKLAGHQDEINELVEASDWEDAELFSKVFFASPSSIAKDDNLMNAMPKTVKGFGNLIKALANKWYIKRYKAGWYRRVERDGYKYVDVTICREFKRHVNGILGLVRLFSFDRLIELLQDFGVEVDRELLAPFEALYKIQYNALWDSCNVLYHVIVCGVSFSEASNQIYKIIREAQEQEEA